MNEPRKQKLERQNYWQKAYHARLPRNLVVIVADSSHIPTRFSIKKIFLDICEGSPVETLTSASQVPHRRMVQEYPSANTYSEGRRAW